MSLAPPAGGYQSIQPTFPGPFPHRGTLYTLNLSQGVPVLMASPVLSQLTWLTGTVIGSRVHAVPALAGQRPVIQPLTAVAWVVGLNELMPTTRATNAPTSFRATTSTPA